MVKKSGNMVDIELRPHDLKRHAAAVVMVKYHVNEKDLLASYKSYSSGRSSYVGNF
jgi:hypothetical protein